jgi:agmatine/peptidylarginine deiminase
MAIRIPAEWELHSRCGMAWAVQKQDWGSLKAVNNVKGDLAKVILEISRFEPVQLLTPSDRLADAQARFSPVTIVEAPVDDSARSLQPPSAVPTATHGRECA